MRGRFDVIGSNTYLSSGDYRPTVDVESFGGVFGTTSITLTNIAHVGPRIRVTGRTFSATHGKLFSGQIGSFTVADKSVTAKQLIANADWGDGKTSRAVIVALGDGKFILNGKHKYARAGKFRVSILVSLHDWSSGSARSTAVVR